MSRRVLNGLNVNALQISSGAASGYVAQSDGSGNVTWTQRPADFYMVVQTNTRTTGIGDALVGMYVGRAITVTGWTLQFGTADASGSTTVELDKNGSQVSGSSLAVTAANQADGTSTDSARTVTLGTAASYAVGDRLAFNITALGTTPGKVLGVWVKAYYT